MRSARTITLFSSGSSTREQDLEIHLMPAPDDNDASTERLRLAELRLQAIADNLSDVIYQLPTSPGARIRVH
ncbi:MAG: hypothetical protein ACRDH9_12385 [Actinomycetota bacterium]